MKTYDIIYFNGQLMNASVEAIDIQQAIYAAGVVIVDQIISIKLRGM